MDPWTDIEKDTLQELLNLGIGRASAALSRLTGEPVDMSIPNVMLDRTEEVLKLVQSWEHDQMIVIREDFRGSFSGNACLIFPDRQSLELVRLILPDSAPTDMVTEIAQEALMEVGNIVLNAALATVSNFLASDLETGLPYFERWNAEAIGNDENSPHAILLEVSIALQKTGIKGYLITLMQPKSIQALQSAIAHLSEHPEQMLEHAK